MPDDHRHPTLGRLPTPPQGSKRAPTFGDRNEGNRPRVVTPPKGLMPPRQDDAAPVDFETASTGVLQGAALDAARAERTIPEAIAHHDRRLDAHAAQLAELKIADIRIEGGINTTNATLYAHTAILGAQSSQLDRILNESSAERMSKGAAQTERATATYKTVLAWTTPIVTLVVGALVARGC